MTRDLPYVQVECILTVTVLLTKRRTAKKVKNKYDFLDLGCKVGGSIDWSQRKYGGLGLGVDLKEDVIKQARKNGHHAISGNILELDFPENSFRFVSMMDFLEHLPAEEDVIHVLEKCKKWASEFFFIHHPSFESMEYLKKHSLKLDWTDWSGHTSPLTIKDFQRIFAQLGLKNYTVEQTMEITDSFHHKIVPLSAPTDTVGYQPGLGPKKDVSFDQPVFGRVELYVPTTN